MARKKKPYKWELRAEKNRTAKIAKELLYPKEVIEKIRNAESKEDIQKIMIQARRNKGDEEI